MKLKKFTPWPLSRLALLILLASHSPNFALAQNQAGGTTPHGPAPVAPYDSGFGGPVNEANRVKALEDPNYESCGLNCTYHKANENMTLQTDYMDRKLSFLLQEGPSVEEKFSVLGDFCNAEEKADKFRYLDRCISRYQQMHSFWSYRARGVIGRNEDAIVRLQCSQVDSNGNCLNSSEAITVQSLQDPTLKIRPAPSNRFVQAPYFPTFQEVNQLAARTAPAPLKRLEDVIDDYEPRMEDFIDYIPVSDPKSPSTTMHTPMKDAKGRFVYSDRAKNAYTIAHEEWLKLKKQNPGQKKLAMGKLGTQSGGKPTPQGTPAMSELGWDLTREIYNSARKHQVDQVNQFMTEMVSPRYARQVSYPAPRAGGAKNPKDPTVSPLPGSSSSPVAKRTEQPATGLERVRQIRVNELSKRSGSGQNTTALYDSYTPDSFVLPSTRPNESGARVQGQTQGQFQEQLNGPSSSDSMKQVFE